MVVAFVIVSNGVVMCTFLYDTIIITAYIFVSRHRERNRKGVRENYIIIVHGYIVHRLLLLIILPLL